MNINRSVAHRKPICGVGINDANYVVSPKIDGRNVKCKLYRTWSGMIERCYSGYGKYKAYRDCTVCPEWHSFMAFRGWMEKQDWQFKELDKDILISGNKVYSPDTCMFVSRKINVMVAGINSGNGSYLQGVGFNKKCSKFCTQLSVAGKARTLGYFETEQLAHEAYLKAKAAHIYTVAMEQEGILKKALIRISEELLTP